MALISSGKITKSNITATNIGSASATAGNTMGSQRQFMWYDEVASEDAVPLDSQQMTPAQRQLLLDMYQVFSELGLRKFMGDYFDNPHIRPSNDKSDEAFIALALYRVKDDMFLRWEVAQVQVDEDSIPKVYGMVRITAPGLPTTKAGFAAKRIELAGQSRKAHESQSEAYEDRVIMPKEVVFRDLCRSIDGMFRSFSLIERERKNDRQQAERMATLQAYERSLLASKSAAEQRAIQSQIDAFTKKHNIRTPYGHLSSYSSSSGASMSTSELEELRQYYEQQSAQEKADRKRNNPASNIVTNAKKAKKGKKG